MALVGRISGISDAATRLSFADESLRKAARIPALATLLGLEWRRAGDGIAIPPGTLLSRMASRHLQRTERGTIAESVLARIACACIDAPAGEATFDEFAAEFAQVAGAGIVRRRRDGLGFEHAIMRDWFGARALALGIKRATSVVLDAGSRLRWVMPAAILLASESFERTSAIVAEWARSDPSFFSAALRRSTAKFGEDGSGVPDAPTCAARLQLSADAVLTGLAPLAELAFPTREGHVVTPEVVVAHPHVSVSWVNGATPGAGRRLIITPPSQPAWPWRVVQDEVARLVDRDRRNVGRRQGWAEAAYEMMWEGALSKLALPIGITTGVPEADALRAGLLGTQLLDLGRRLGYLSGDGLVAPWPLPDVAGRLGAPSAYGDARLIARVEQVLRAALRAVRSAAQTAYPLLAVRLRTVRLGSHCLRALVSRGPTEWGSVTWAFIPDASPFPGEVCAQLIDASGERAAESALVESVRTAVRTRPEWRGTSMQCRALASLLQPDAIRALSTTFLDNDLRELDWGES